ncbi:MAG: cytochrome c biogenesis protein CcsA [Halobacteriovoraceae bacterium]|nr:cytochrome c biogenesis protein CcsA [Halobacteriovoraceae bacterium]
MNFYELARSLSLVTTNFNIPSEAVAKKLDLPFATDLNYQDMYKRQKLIQDSANSLAKIDTNKYTEEDKIILFMANRMAKVEADQSARIFKIVPPQFSNEIESNWFSPWQTILQGKGSPLTVKFFGLWGELSDAYLNSEEFKWSSISQEISKLSLKMSNGRIDHQRINWESDYNKWDLFTKAIAIYILGFLILSLSWIYKGALLQKISYGLLILGFIPHLFGLTLRCYIMNRPPVSTLYESVIFVAIVSVFSAIIYEKIKKNGVGTFIGMVLGIFLLFVSFGYEKQGDSMGMLVAVLNTNFWLATHVVTITIGYGCSFVASVLGHVYLVQTAINLKTKSSRFDLPSLNKSMNGATLYALFFVVLGTILGGIWADQSWGRFWGWDPKENGAMLICLWLLFILHGRLAGFFKPRLYAIGLVLTSIIVAVAWFGVNLLNVGLHSYGFTDSIAYNLLAFSLFEIIFSIVIYLLILNFQKETNK